MSTQIVFAAAHGAANAPTRTRFVNGQRVLVVLTAAALVLTSCGTAGLTPLGDEPVIAGSETGTGCPTPTPEDDLGLEANGGTAGQSVQADAVQEAAIPAGEQGSVPSLAEREAMLDRVNQGPARTDAPAGSEGVPPVPNLVLQPDVVQIDTSTPVSDTSAPDTSETTPTPCP